MKFVCLNFRSEVYKLGELTLTFLAEGLISTFHIDITGGVDIKVLSGENSTGEIEANARWKHTTTGFFANQKRVEVW